MYVYFSMGRVMTPNYPFFWGAEPRLLGPARVYNPNSISVGSAVLAQLAVVSD